MSSNSEIHFLIGKKGFIFFNVEYLPGGGGQEHDLIILNYFYLRANVYGEFILVKWKACNH